MKLIVILIIFILSIQFVSGEDLQEPQGVATSLFKGKTYVKNPLDLRDPFKRKINKKSHQQRVTKNHEVGIYSNQIDRIEDKPIESIRIVGVITGEKRMAMAKMCN